MCKPLANLNQKKEENLPKIYKIRMGQGETPIKTEKTL